MVSEKARSGQTKILLVEDDESISEAVVLGLSHEGFAVVTCADGTEAAAKVKEAEPDVVLLDVMLPGQSGFDVCKEIRSFSEVPIIIVTARSETTDVVVGLEVGADDYVVKPFRLRELVARIRSVLRRRGKDDNQDDRGRDDGKASAFGVVEIGGVRIDPDHYQIWVRGEEVQARRKEFELLAILMENAGRVLTRASLIENVWGTSFIGNTKTLDVHINRLRSLVESNPASPEIIKTVRGVGYRFEKAKAAQRGVAD